MDKKHIKYLVIAIIGIISFGSLLYVNYYVLPYLEPPKTEESDNFWLLYINGIPQQNVSNITMIIDYSELRPTEIHQNFTLKNGFTTAYYALIKFCMVDIRWYGPQAYVRKINGIGEGWTYKVNGISPFAACNFYNLNNFDVIQWIYVGM